MAPRGDEATWWRRDESYLYITVKVTPGARRDEVLGVADGALRVKVTAPPVDGAANERLRAVMAKALGVRRSAVRVERGETSRSKVIRVVGLSAPPPGVGD